MLKALIIKEFLQIKRNPFLPRFILIFPIVVMLVIPWITTLDVHNVHITAIDNDRSSLSRRLLNDLDAAPELIVTTGTMRYERALECLEQGKTDIILEIPCNYEKNLTNGHIEKMAISANAVNALKGITGLQYVVQSLGNSLSKVGEERGIVITKDDVVVQNRYNPTMNYRHYMIPAIMIMLLIILCGFLPSLSLVSEKEKGTLEQINVTPVTRLTFTLSKLIPYWIIGLFVLSVAMLIAFGVYRLSPAGSVATVYCGALLFVLAISGLGVAVANRSEKMQQTMFIMFFFMIVFILMSGLLTPISSMPLWAQRLTLAFPPRYFVEIMRTVYLKGATFTEVGPQLLALTGFAAALNLIAAVSYRKQE